MVKCEEWYFLIGDHFDGDHQYFGEVRIEEMQLFDKVTKEWKAATEVKLYREHSETNKRTVKMILLDGHSISFSEAHATIEFIKRCFKEEEYS